MIEYVDLLSRLGVASAHPGGFKATKQLVEEEVVPTGSHILEVGCGTGKSACYLARRGYRVTALDQHSLMLEKAKTRAINEGVDDIEWIEGNVLELPFDNDTFDVVFAESVTIFTDIPQAIKEYHRVLKPGGRLLDREIVRTADIPTDIYTEITDFFSIPTILTVDEWLNQLNETGFQYERPDIGEFMSHENTMNNEDIKELDFDALFEPGIAEGIMKYSELMLAQEAYFGVCVFQAVKNG